MYKRVIVPLDGSPLAEGVLPFILEVAGPLDVEVVLLRVIEHDVRGAYVHFDDIGALRGQAQTYLAPLAEELRARGVRVETAVRTGEPVDQILACTREAGADLIAMTTHGRSGLGRLLFGSVAEAVLRQADVPVFLMRLTKVPAPRRATAGALS